MSDELVIARYKPAYRVPTMAEVRATPHNGFYVASTFAGCGGSSTGYRLAGFKVLWANEFIPTAFECYRANMDEHTKLDERDIRQIKPEEILAAIGLKRGELDVLDGSPPCASFSTAGQHQETWGMVRKYSETHQRVDDLFFEFARVLAGVQPRVFVAENVSGLVKGASKGWFLDILTTFKRAGYKVAAKLLDAQWLGVPQMRARLMFVGVRNDLNAVPVHPRPLPYRYSLRDALPHIAHAYHGYGCAGFGKKGRRGLSVQLDEPCPTILTVDHEIMIDNGPGPNRNYRRGIGGSEAGWRVVSERRKFTIEEVKKLCSFPDDFVLTGRFAQQWERLGRAVPPLMMRAIATTIRDEILIPLGRRDERQTSGAGQEGSAGDSEDTRAVDLQSEGRS